MPIDDQVAAVGQPLTIELRASDRGNPIHYGFSADAPDLANSASVVDRPDGSGLFIWTPSAAAMGTWSFHFSASDGNGESKESASIEVRSAVGSGSMPVFRRPLGAGTAVALESGGCVEVEVEATDQDSPRVTFAEEQPTIEGATLDQGQDLQAVWRWCPSDDQMAAQDRYLLTLSADDGENPKAIKRYQIILRDPHPKSCGGDPPVLQHAAADRTSRNPLALSLDVSDDVGLKAAPLVYVATTAPADPPDLRQMTELTTSLASGDTRSGTWTVALPNPVAAAAAGAQATVYYVVVVEDNDDAGGTCDHLVEQSFQMKVTAPDGGEGGLGLCEPCTSDAQCGGAGDDCLRVGVEGDSFCFTACSGASGDCPDGYVCSAQEVESVDGARARQCVPVGQSCVAGGACADDSREDNDGRSQAAPIQQGTTGGLRMCPAGDIQADEDWFRFTVGGDTRTTIKIAGDTYPNMELALLDDSGKLVAVSEDWGSDDDVERCLPPGSYEVRVYSYFTGENDYSLELDEQPGDCPAPGGGTCTDDPFEDDDDAMQARTPDFEAQVFRATDQQICAGDDDWFYVYLFSDETLYGALSFDQTTVAQDLDFQVYDGTGAMLVGCSEADPSTCSASNGQSGDSNERLLFTAPDAGDYFVVVHGWDGSENSYGVCLSLDTDQCGS